MIRFPRDPGCGPRAQPHVPARSTAPLAAASTWRFKGPALLGRATAAALVVFCHVASAQVYRCVDATGATSFSDAPCRSASQGGRIEIRPNTLDHSGEREQALKAENLRLQGQLGALQNAAPATAQAAAPQPSRLDSFACRQARRDLEVAASSIEKNRAMIQARQSAMYGACGQQEPNQQITNIRIENEPGRVYGPVLARPRQ